VTPPQRRALALAAAYPSVAVAGTTSERDTCVDARVADRLEVLGLLELRPPDERTVGAWAGTETAAWITAAGRAAL